MFCGHTSHYWIWLGLGEVVWSAVSILVLIAWLSLYRWGLSGVFWLRGSGFVVFFILNCIWIEFGVIWISTRKSMTFEVESAVVAAVLGDVEQPSRLHNWFPRFNVYGKLLRDLCVRRISRSTEFDPLCNSQGWEIMLKSCCVSFSGLSQGMLCCHLSLFMIASCFGLMNVLSRIFLVRCRLYSRVPGCCWLWKEVFRDSY